MQHIHLAIIAALIAAAPCAAQSPTVSLRVSVGDSIAAMLDIAASGQLPTDTATMLLHGERHRVEGPRLLTVLQHAGVSDLVQQKGAKLARAIIAAGADGYRVAFATADVDPTIREQRILLVLLEDGVPRQTLRLAVPDDQRGARSVRDLVELRVVTLP